MLWTADLVSKTVAVAASGASEAVGAAAMAVLDARGAPKNDVEKRQTRRLMDAAIRAALNNTPSALDESKRAYQRLLRLMDKMTSEESAAFRAWVGGAE